MKENANLEELENFKMKLEEAKMTREELEKCTFNTLLTLYGNIVILISKSMTKYSKEITYPAQIIQDLIYCELKDRCAQ